MGRAKTARISAKPLEGKRLKFNMIRSLLSLLFLLNLTSILHADELRPIKNAELTNILSNLEIIAELEGPPLMIRVLRVRDHGECDGRPESCPLSTLFISVSEYDEYPEQIVYRLPKRHSWKFTKWQKEPSNEKLGEAFEIELRADLPSKNIKKDLWVQKSYIFKANIEKGQLTEKQAF